MEGRILMAATPYPVPLMISTQVNPVTKIRDWVQIGGPAGNIYAGGFGIFATNPDTGDLYHYLETQHRWVKVGGDWAKVGCGGMNSYYVSDTGLYGSAWDGNLWQYTGNGYNVSWVNISSGNPKIGG